MKKKRILLVDNDKSLLRVLSYQVQQLGFHVVETSSPRDALETLAEESVDLVITDLRMPEMDGIQFLEAVHRTRSELPVVVLTAHGSIEVAVEAIQKGAFDFLTKPIEVAEIEHTISRALKMASLVEENQRLAKAILDKFRFEGIIGSSKKFRDVLDLSRQLAAVDTTVLIQGESGTGKELIARPIHFNSAKLMSSETPTHAMSMFAYWQQQTKICIEWSKRVISERIFSTAFQWRLCMCRVYESGERISLY
jgi:DNA-binding NtrC family response regulator